MKNKKETKFINIPDAKLNRIPLTRQELLMASKDRVSRISREFAAGFEFINHYPKSVTFFGSTRLKKGDPYHEKAIHLAEEISKLGYTVVTGGGPGIMEAANHGAYNIGGPSLGFNIQLPYEQVLNPYVTKSQSFYYFFSRKVALSFSAESYVYFPGGYGTMDEFFEILTLVQTNKIPKVPIVLVGSDFWKPLDEFIREHLFEKYKTIDKKDFSLYKITDDEREILKIIGKAPMRDE